MELATAKDRLTDLAIFAAGVHFRVQILNNVRRIDNPPVALSKVRTDFLLGLCL